MTEATCIACGQRYFAVAGHSCSDTENTREVRRQLAKEIVAKQKLEEGIQALEEIVTPIAIHHSGNYNKWRRDHPNGLSYMEARQMLSAYIEKRSIQKKK